MAFSNEYATCVAHSYHGWSSLPSQCCLLGILRHSDASQPECQWWTGSDLKLNKSSTCQRWCLDSKGYLIPVLKAGRWGEEGGGGNRVRGGGSGWGSRGSSADMSQLHAWLAMLTLTLTRQRGDTSRPAGARVCGHVHAHAGIYSYSHACIRIYSMSVCRNRQTLHTIMNYNL